MKLKIKNRKPIFICAASLLISGFGAFTLHHLSVLKDNQSNFQKNLSDLQESIKGVQSGLSMVNTALSDFKR